jgi:hypothetical protein
VKDSSLNSRLQSWATLVDGDIPHATFTRLQSHPSYRAAARKFMSGSLTLAAQDKRVDGIFKDIGRYAASIWAIYLHFTGGLTLPRLKEVCARSKVLSPGRARALLIYLQLLGYVKVLPKSEAGPKQYTPSALLIGTMKAQSRIGLEALAMIDPAFQIVVDNLDTPEVFSAFMVEFGEGALNASVAVDQDSPFWNIFLMRNAGAQILQSLLVADADSGGRPTAVSVAAMARQLNVARSHVTRVLQLAEKAKLLERGPDGTVILLDELRRDADEAFALRLVGYAICGAHAAQFIPGN